MTAEILITSLDAVTWAAFIVMVSIATIQIGLIYYENEMGASLSATVSLVGLGIAAVWGLGFKSLSALFKPEYQDTVPAFVSVAGPVAAHALAFLGIAVGAILMLMATVELAYSILQKRAAPKRWTPSRLGFFLFSIFCFSAEVFVFLMLIGTETLTVLSPALSSNIIQALFLFQIGVAGIGMIVVLSIIAALGRPARGNPEAAASTSRALVIKDTPEDGLVPQGAPK